MSKYNNLSIEVYSTRSVTTGGAGSPMGLLLALTASSGASTTGIINTSITDPKNDLLKAESIQYRTIYPGGIDADASFFVPRPVVDWWELNGANRVVFRNDTRQCYEGYITNFQREKNEADEGIMVRTTGAWGHILMNWPIRKRWADNRVTNDAWTLQTALGTLTLQTEEWNIERQNRIHINPKAGQFASGEYIALRYEMPIGETIKRIYYAYDFEEKAGQSWEQSMWRSTDGATFTQMGTSETYAAGSTTIHTATGVGTVDVTLATPSRYVELRYYSRGSNNPVNDDHNHGTWNSLKVYSETGSINMEEIAKDIIGTVTDLNSETRFISSATSPLSLVPFMADDFESAADVLNQAASQGDAAYNRWAVGLISSEYAFVPDGKPLLALYPYITASITSYDLVVSMDDDNLVHPLTISEDYDSIANWIVVRYTDETGVMQYRTPADNASLKDDTSINAYGRHGFVVNVPNTSTSSIADTIGQRYLATYKDPQFRLISPITVREFIRGVGGLIYPASEIHAGYRVLIEDYSNVKLGASQGAAFVITQTTYDADTEICQMTAGVPDAPLMLRYTPPLYTSEGTHAGEPAGRPDPVQRSVTGAMLKRMGLTRSQWAKMTPAQRRARKKKAGL